MRSSEKVYTTKTGHSGMTGFLDIAGEFAHAYYAHFVYVPNELCKFYDQDNATVWREEFGDRHDEGCKFACLLSDILSFPCLSCLSFEH
jgi:hypothetical protein